MANKAARRSNERFFDAYIGFDENLCERFGVEEDGVRTYMLKMKECYLEARDAITEWDITYTRLGNMRKRYQDLNNGGATFDDFQGKDEDVVWMQVFREKLDAQVDPLSKYSRMDFSKKNKKKGLLAKLFGLK